MPTVRADVKYHLYWAVVDASDKIIAAGLMEPGGITGTGSDKTLVSGKSENDYLLAADAKAISFKPLTVGESMRSGDIRSYNNELVVVRKDTSWTGIDPKLDTTTFCTYSEDANADPDWVAGEEVEKGAARWA